jgi:TPP-dependent pyruvate/acetoin dehydrogenase alpha subunit
MMAELYGKATGICRGKGGSLHIADFSIGMLGATGIVGAGLPLAAGAGLAIKLKKTDQVVAAFFGDGASNQGTFHESINLSAVWKLPVLFVCENNQYAESTRISDMMLVENVSDRAKAYGIPGETLDGMDVLAVHKGVKKHVDGIRKGGGPVLLECKTYRYFGHEVGDPWWTYRSKEEVEEWKKKDPIGSFEKRLISMNLMTKEDAKLISQEIKDLIEESVKFGMDSPFPEPQEAFKDVFASPYF